MTLRERSAAVARAGRGREQARFGGAILGALILGLGFHLRRIPLAGAGGVLLGIALGELGMNPERRYMEGIVDGLDIADAAPAGLTGRHPGDVPGLQGGAPADGPARAARALDFDQRAARGAGPGAAGEDDPGAPFGIHLEHRPPRTSTALDGSPVVAAQGPRRTSFPAVEPPAARPSDVVGPKTRREARPIERARRSTKKE